MRFKKKITIMHTSELEDLRGLWIRRLEACTKSNFWWWRFNLWRCTRKIARINKEIRFKELLRSGFKVLNDSRYK